MIALPRSKTKIVATIGPASDSSEMLERLTRAGLNVARLNFSHGDFAGHAEQVRRIRRASEAVGRRVAIMADLPGPKIRIGMGGMPREGIAKDGVFGIGRAATDDVAGVKVAHHNGNLPLLKPLYDLLPQKQTDVTQPDVSRRIALLSGIFQKLLACAFGDGKDCVPARHHPMFQGGEKSTSSLLTRSAKRSTTIQRCAIA